MNPASEKIAAVAFYDVFVVCCEGESELEPVIGLMSAIFKHVALKGKEVLGGGFPICSKTTAPGFPAVVGIVTGTQNRVVTVEVFPVDAVTAMVAEVTAVAD